MWLQCLVGVCVWLQCLVGVCVVTVFGRCVCGYSSRLYLGFGLA